MARFSSCSDARRQRINQSLQNVQAVIDRWDLRCLIDLRDTIQEYLDCAVVISCQSCNVNGWSVPGSDAFTLCTAFLDSSTIQRIAAVAFHEMVHAAGGTELDAEALENHFFAGNGATAPTSGDFTSFRSDGGEFVEWDESTGLLYELCMDESYDVSRGAQLNPTFIA